jgi:hypothetical protein
VVEKLRNTVLDHLNKFTKINGTASLIIKELDVLPKIRETEKQSTTEAAPEEPVAKQQPVAALSRKGKPLDQIKKIIATLHKYIRREPKPGGGYRYIYEEPKEGSKKNF